MVVTDYRVLYRLPTDNSDYQLVLSMPRADTSQYLSQLGWMLPGILLIALCLGALKKGQQTCIISCHRAKEQHINVFAEQAFNFSNLFFRAGILRSLLLSARIIGIRDDFIASLKLDDW